MLTAWSPGELAIPDCLSWLALMHAALGRSTAYVALVVTAHAREG